MKKVAVLLSIASLALLASCGKKVEPTTTTGAVSNSSAVETSTGTDSNVTSTEATEETSTQASEETTTGATN